MDGDSLHTQPARSLDELEAEITELAGHFNAAEHRWLTLVAEYDRRNGWSDGACHSCAHWLNFKCGLALGAARKKVRVAHALEKLPKISAAMSRGQLSYSKVRALTRIANADIEDYLLFIALHGTAEHVERLVQGFRRAKEAEELSREACQQATRGLSYLWDDDGSLVLRGRLPAEIGALFLKALDAASEGVSRATAAAGSRVARIAAILMRITYVTGLMVGKQSRATSLRCVRFIIARFTRAAWWSRHTR